MNSKIPFRVSPMLATLVKEPFDRPGWIYEEKYDGVRMLAYKEAGRVSLISRNAIDRTERYREIADEILKLKPDTLVLDGEIVVFDKREVSHFQLLQQSKGPAKYVVFDCLYADRRDLSRERYLSGEKHSKSCCGDTQENCSFSPRSWPPMGLMRFELRRSVISKDW